MRSPAGGGSVQSGTWPVPWPGLTGSSLAFFGFGLKVAAGREFISTIE